MDRKWRVDRSELNRQVREMALAHDGVVTVEDLASLGFTRSMIQTRTESGLLIPVVKGSFALPGTILSSRGRSRAALGGLDRGVVLSHESALDVHGLVRGRGTVHVVGEGGRFYSPHRWSSEEFGFEVVRHQTRWLPAEHITVVDGIRTTTAEQALRDYASVAKPTEITKALTQGEKERSLCWAKLRAIVAASNGHKGIAILRREIELWDPAFADTRSDPEVDFLLMVRREGMPKPSVNEPVGRHIPDFLWRHLNLAVELDPYGTHSGKAAHRRDHRKGVELEITGLRVIRFTWEDQYLHEDRTASELWTVLRQQAELLQVPLFPPGSVKQV